MTVGAVTQWPLPLAPLQKGSVVSVGEIEKAFSERFGTTGYQHAALRLKEIIERYFARDRGVVVTVRQERGALVILDDSAASDHNPREVVRGLAKAKRAHARNMAVDTRGFEADKVAKHRRQLEVDGKTLQAATSVRRRELRPEPHVRRLPGVKP